MINKAIIGGRLTHDPEETVAAQTGKTISRFSVAVPRRYNRDETDFLNVVAFGKTAEFVNKYFTKGSPILVVGSVQTRSWEQDGQKRYKTEIVAEEVSFAGSKKESASEESSAAAEYPDNATEALESLRNGFVPVDDDDDLAF